MQRSIAVNVKNAILIIQATVCLYNFLIKKDLNLPIENRSYFVNVLIQNANACETLHSLEHAKDNAFCGSTVRDLFTQYFCTSGAIKQQWTKAYTNDF